MPELRHPRPGSHASHRRAGGRVGADRRVEVALTVLVLGIGNPGRRDDGLGARLVEALADDARVQAELRYQLGIEDALAVRDADAVVFADASRTGEAPASLTSLAPDPRIAFTSHALAPAAVLALCRELYGRTPPAWILSVRGYDWGVGEGLSEGAERNFAAALDLLREFLTINRK